MEHFKKNIVYLAEIPIVLFLVYEKGIFKIFFDEFAPLPINPYLLKIIVLVLGTFSIWLITIFFYRSLTRDVLSALKAMTVFNMLFGAVLSFQYVMSITGNINNCYAIGPEGPVIVPCHYSQKVEYLDERVHPEYLTPVRPLTPNILEAIRQGFDSKRMCIGRDTEFFIEGRPVIYYYKWDHGSYEFFDGPGFHRQTSAPLIPVTRKKVEEILGNFSMFQKKTICDHDPILAFLNGNSSDLKVHDLLGAYNGFYIEQGDSLFIHLQVSNLNENSISGGNNYTFSFTLDVEKNGKVARVQNYGTMIYKSDAMLLFFQDFGVANLEHDKHMGLVIKSQKKRAHWFLKKVDIS